MKTRVRVISITMVIVFIAAFIPFKASATPPVCPGCGEYEAYDSNTDSCWYCGWGVCLDCGGHRVGGGYGPCENDWYCPECGEYCYCSWEQCMNCGEGKYGHCPECGAIYPTEQRLCPNDWDCAFCGERLPCDYDMCVYCGHDKGDQPAGWECPNCSEWAYEDPCEHCGYFEGAFPCDECGEWLDEGTDVCPYCGHEYNVYYGACPLCGSDVALDGDCGYICYYCGWQGDNLEENCEYCPWCGAELDPDTLLCPNGCDDPAYGWCPECGAPLVWDAHICSYCMWYDGDAEWICPFCGTANSPWEMPVCTGCGEEPWCPMCGALVNTDWTCPVCDGTWICEYCGTENSNLDYECYACGVGYGGYNYCGECGELVYVHDAVCSNCGAENPLYIAVEEPEEPEEPVSNQPVYTGSSEPSRPYYKDVVSDTTNYKAIIECTRNGWIDGNENEFQPYNESSRDVVAVALGRMSTGKKLSNIEARKWCEDAKIIIGYSNGDFGYNDNITVEQLSVILYRYAVLAKISIDSGADASDIDGFEYVGGWASDAVKWFYGKKLDCGLHPVENIDRATLCEILVKFSKLK